MKTLSDYPFALGLALARHEARKRRARRATRTYWQALPWAWGALLCATLGALGRFVWELCSAVAGR